VLQVDVCKIGLTQVKKSRRRFEFVKHSTEGYVNCTGDAEPELGLEINKLIYVTKKNTSIQIGYDCILPGDHFLYSF
jgi:hypothetical protein